MLEPLNHAFGYAFCHVFSAARFTSCRPSAAAGLAGFVAASGVLLLAGCAELEGEGEAEAAISHVLEANSSLETDVQPTHPRVQENGLLYPFAVSVRGHQQQTVRIAAWTNDNRLLGSRNVVPPYANTEWKRLSLFIPYSAVHTGGESVDGAVYVLDPNDSRRFLATVGMGVTSIAPERLIWDFQQLDEDVVLAGGERGIRLRAKLHRFGYTDTEHRVILAVRDAKREDFPVSLGGPIRLESRRLEAPADSPEHLTWTLELTLAYAALERLGDGRAVTLTPAVRMSDGTVRMGNIHVEFLAGGTPETIAGRLREDIRETDSRIRTLERELDVLQGK